MKFPAAALLCFLLTIGTALSAHSQDCDGILSRDILSRSNVVNQSAARSAVANSYCSMSFQEAQQSGSLQAGVEYGLFNASGTQTEAGYNSFRQQNCGESSASQFQQRFIYNAQRALGEGVVQAWENCKLQSVGLSCSPGHPAAAKKCPS